MFENAIIRVEQTLDVRIEEELDGILEEDVLNEVTQFAEEHEGESLSTAEIGEHFSSELDALWTLESPSNELHSEVINILAGAEIEMDSYAIYHLSQIQTSMVANLLYASAVVSKWTEEEEPIHEELIDETCEIVFDKALLRC